MPQLAFANSFRASYDALEKTRDTRMRTIRIHDFRRSAVLAPDDGSDVFPLWTSCTSSDAHTWATERLYTRLYTTNTATRVLEVLSTAPVEQVTPHPEKVVAAAGFLWFVRHPVAEGRVCCSWRARAPGRRSWSCGVGRGSPFLPR
ncbi:hypothetical protein ACFWOL_13705 [Streptomyces sp. NPDC058442]|uniref:hypothetical protein n=1 Tax=Streptomyces sp. NPDC058442 TaxID=3346503 RepID=UPI00364C6E38